MLRNIIKKHSAFNNFARYMSTDIQKAINTGISTSQGDAKITKGKPHDFKHKYDRTNPVVDYKDIEKIKPTPLHEVEKDVSKVLKAKAGNKDRTDFFYKVAQHEDGDHAVIKKAKDGIKRLIDEELEFLDFVNKLSKDDTKKLVDDTYDSIEKIYPTTLNEIILK